MKIRIGAIGPEDSVERAKRVTERYNDLELKPFIYDATEKTADIIKEHQHTIDQWFFSGPVPYEYAINQGLIEPNEGAYATMHGSSLHGTVLNAIMDQGRIIKSFSLDSIDQEQLNSVKTSSGISQMKIYNYEQSGYIPGELLVDYHEILYREGKTDLAITCIHSVCQQLREKGIPVYRVVPSDLSVQLAIDYLRQRAYTLSYRKKQLVIVGVEVCYPSTIEEGFVPYKIQHSELELTRVLLKFSENINGSFVKVGNGKYFIYATRGDLELYRQTNSIEELCEHIYSHSELKVRIGIGYGHTVFEADEHVHIAFDYARRDSHHHIILVDEDKEVVELRGRKHSNVVFQQRFSHRKWKEKFSEMKISTTQLSKIYALAKHYETDEITSQELAIWLQSTERNARRILQELERTGLAKVTGEEAGQRGRPRKVYQLLDTF